MGIYERKKTRIFIQKFVGFEVLTAVVIFWDTTPCSLWKINQSFGGTYRLNLQGRRISRARNQHEIRWQAALLSGWFLVRLIFRP
jgi:hypothetical protein